MKSGEYTTLYSNYPIGLQDASSSRTGYVLTAA